MYLVDMLPHIIKFFLNYFFLMGDQVRLLKDKDTGQNKGYAFVTFTSEENAEKAIETLNDSEVKVS